MPTADPSAAPLTRRLVDRSDAAERQRYIASLEAAGIISSSWTLREGRGRGCLSHFVAWSREVVRARGGSIVLAFMTESNASRRRLAAAGADLIATSYALWERPADGEGAAPTD